MPKEFLVEEHEICSAQKVRAEGYLDAISQILPWDVVDVEIKWSVREKKIEVLDKKTDFKYTVTSL